MGIARKRDSVGLMHFSDHMAAPAPHRADPVEGVHRDRSSVDIPDAPV